MSDSLKYAVVERERRYIVASLPEGVITIRDILDRYVTGTRLRLREVREDDGSVTRKLTQKVSLAEGPAEVACTNFYSTTRSGHSSRLCLLSCFASGDTSCVAMGCLSRSMSWRTGH